MDEYYVDNVGYFHQFVDDGRFALIETLQGKIKKMLTENIRFVDRPDEKIASDLFNEIDKHLKNDTNGTD